MSDMKCPFCQQELVRHWGMKEPALYCCDNPKCSRGGVATESSWQELICTRKALKITTTAIDEILYLDSGKFCKEPAEMWKIAKSAKDKITALTKGGDNE